MHMCRSAQESEYKYIYEHVHTPFSVLRQITRWDFKLK